MNKDTWFSSPVQHISKLKVKCMVTITERKVAAEDGDIVSESDEDRPDSHLGVQLDSEETKGLI